MQYVDVQFARAVADPSLEAAVHRWVARLERMGIAVRRAAITIEPDGRRRTAVSLAVTAIAGGTAVAAISHADPYFAISEAFRTARRRILERTAVLHAA